MTDAWCVTVAEVFPVPSRGTAVIGTLAGDAPIISGSRATVLRSSAVLFETIVSMELHDHGAPGSIPLLLVQVPPDAVRPGDVIEPLRP